MKFLRIILVDFAKTRKQCFSNSVVVFTPALSAATGPRQVDMFQNLVVTDYMFVKDRLFASLNLNEKEMSLYDTVANMMERKVIHPDLVIFLQADTETLMENIAKRGRDFEKNMSEDYIDALNQVYNEYFFRYQDTPLIIINTNNIDFVQTLAILRR